MSIITVNGIIEADKLGIVSPHEHALIDMRTQFMELLEISKINLSNQKVGIENIFQLKRNPFLIKDNLILDDPKVAEDELLEFKSAGGDTIVDASSVGLGRDPITLRRISRNLNLNIVLGCGYYVAFSQSIGISKKTIEEIADEMINDIEVGICESSIESKLIANGSKGQNTGIRAGVIGEIGTSEIIYPFEKKVLIAAARVQSRTGLGVLVHTNPWAKRGLEILDILEKNGADLKKVVICHVGVTIDMEYYKQIIKRGSYIEFDDFGKEFIMDGKKLLFATDIERIDAIIELINDGCIFNILMSVDVCLKSLLHKYGGCGYDHILTNIVPIMIRRGLTMNQINVIIKNNPKKLLDSNLR